MGNRTSTLGSIIRGLFLFALFIFLLQFVKNLLTLVSFVATIYFFLKYDKIVYNDDGMKERYKKLSIISAIIFVILISIPNISSEDTIQRTEKENVDKRIQVEETVYEEATVKKVLNGDLLEVSDGHKTYKLKLIGVDSPMPLDTSILDEKVIEFTENELLDKKIYLEKDISNTNREGRILRYVWLRRPGRTPSEEEIEENMFNAILVREGYAYSTANSPDLRYQDIFEKLERESKKYNRGLWNKETEKEFEESRIKELR